MATIAELLTLTQPDAQQTAVSQGTGLNAFANTYKDALRAALNDTSAILGMYTNITQDGRAQRYNNEVGEATPIQQLAVILCNEFYPDTDALQSWRYDGFEKAVGAITECLKLAKDNDTQIYPIQWPRVCFDVEKGINPHKKDGLILCGMDPLGIAQYDGPGNRFKATGFAFHLPGAQGNVGSLTGMRDYYKIDCSEDNPKHLLRHNVVMVNMIRTIFKDGRSAGGNAFQAAWTKYTVWFLQQFSNSHTILFNYPYGQPAALAPIVGDIFNGLNVPRPGSDRFKVPPHILFAPSDWPQDALPQRILVVMEHPSRLTSTVSRGETQKQFINRKPVDELLGNAFPAIYGRVPRDALVGDLRNVGLNVPLALVAPAASAAPVDAAPAAPVDAAPAAPVDAAPAAPVDAAPAAPVDAAPAAPVDAAPAAPVDAAPAAPVDAAPAAPVDAAPAAPVDAAPAAPVDAAPAAPVDAAPAAPVDAAPAVPVDAAPAAPVDAAPAVPVDDATAVPLAAGVLVAQAVGQLLQPADGLEQQIADLNV